MNRTQVDFVTIPELDAVFWHLLFVDPGTARRAFIEDAVMHAFQMQGRMNTRNGYVVFKGNIGLRG